LGVLLIVALVFGGLEFRQNQQLLSSIPANVTSTADAGPGSLRQAIANAPNEGIVTLSPTLNGQTIELTSHIELARDVYITAPAGAHVTLTLTSSGMDRVFDITTALLVTIANVTITGDTAQGPGGGIVIEGAGLNGSKTLSLIGDTLANNSAIANGGAVEADNGTQLNVINSAFTNNSTTQNGGAIDTGSGSDTRGIVSVTNSTFTKNFATQNGGAIEVNNTGILNAQTSAFTQNSASQDGGAIGARSSATSGAQPGPLFCLLHQFAYLE
jgi:predicted outer membrane repeat protein